MQNPESKTNTLLFGENPSVAIVTLWTPVEIVQKHLKSSDYGIMGNLYNAERGLDLLIRSLLSNPQIKHLVITGSDMGKSGIVLSDFFEKGAQKGTKKDTGTECWQVQSEHEGYIESDIPKEALDELRESISVYKWEFTTPFQIQWKEPQHARKKMVFEKKQSFAKKFFSEPAGFVFRANGFLENWFFGIMHTNQFGQQGNGKKILFNVTYVLTPNAKPFSIPAFLFFDQNQLKPMAEKIAKELNLSKPTNKTHTIAFSDGSTANVSLHALNSSLIIQVFLGRADAWKMALDLAVLHELGNQYLASAGMEKTVCICVTVAELELLDSKKETVSELLASQYTSIVTPPRLLRDWRGNMVIYVSHGEIVAEHVSPNNELLWMYTGKTALELRDQLMREGIVGTIAHAVYLGMELSKAETALKLGLKYVQDQALDFGQKQ